MAHIRIVDENQAEGEVADDYAFLSNSYSGMLGEGTPTPQVYRINSIVPAYFRFGAVQNRVLNQRRSPRRRRGAGPRDPGDVRDLDVQRLLLLNGIDWGRAALHLSRRRRTRSPSRGSGNRTDPNASSRDVSLCRKVRTQLLVVDIRGSGASA